MGVLLLLVLLLLPGLDARIIIDQSGTEGRCAARAGGVKPLEL